MTTTARTVSGLIKNTDGTYAHAVVQGLEIPGHDYISMSYTGSNVTGVVYKMGGASGTTVATLTLTYDVDDNLLTVTKS
jgi:hypothetical protein